MELYIGCGERTSGSGAVVAHGSSGLVSMVNPAHLHITPTVYHMFLLIMAAGEKEYH